MIRSIIISNFRGIREGMLNEFTPLVVLVGPNGCGKSTVLEAIDLAASPSIVEALQRTLDARPGTENKAKWLFNFPKGDTTKIELTVGTDQDQRTVELSKDNYEIRDGHRTTTLRSVFNPNAIGPIPGSYPIEDDVIHLEVSNALIGTYLLKDVKELRFVHGSTQDSKEKLYQPFSNITEEGKFDSILKILQQLVPGLKDVRILAEGDKPVLAFRYEDRAVPVALAGDGIASLTRIALDFAVPMGGVVLLDEPEAHKHPAAIFQTAKVILAAIRSGIQIILATHSLELLDALVSETKDDEELTKLSLYRLHLDSGHLISSRLDGADVAFARSRIEDDLR